MNATLAAQRPKKEPSLAKMAKQYARGIKDVTPLAFDPFPDVELKADLQRLSDCPPQKLRIADQIWCGTTAKQKAPLDGVKRDVAIKLVKQHLRGAKVEYAKPNGNGHPALTGTTTPAGILANDPDAIVSVPGKDGRSFRDILRSNRPVPEDLAAAAESGAEVEIECERIQVNPDNDHASEKDPEVVALAESIAADKLLQAITVRPTPLAGRENPQLRWKDFEIICGERRWLACQVAGLPTVRCKIRTDTDDAQALRLMVIENAKRRNVNPIVKARNIERLCQSKEEGGGGLTRDQAAKDVGLTDGSSASNLVRLLKLPKVWQDRVAAGELPESFARLIVPVIELGPVLDALEKDWKTKDKPRNHWQANAFDSREKLEASIDDFIDDECRPADELQFTANGKSKQAKIDLADPELRKKLGIVELERPKRNGKKGQTETVAIATNVDAFDKLLEEQENRTAKSQAEKAGRDGPAPKREPTAAERKENAAKQAKMLVQRREVWRHEWLKSLVAARIQDQDWQATKLLCWVLTHFDNWMVRRAGWNRLMEQALKAAGGRGGDWQAVNSVSLTRFAPPAMRDYRTSQRSFELDEALASFLKAVVLQEDKDTACPFVPHEVVDAIAGDYGIDLAKEWQLMQGDKAGRERLERFFLQHQTKQLYDLARELGQHPSVNATRGMIVKQLMAHIGINSSTRFKLPSCIKPLAVPGKRKASKSK